MSVKDNVELIQEGYEAFGRGDIPGVLERFAEDVVWRNPGSPEYSPLAGTYRGHAGVAQFFQKVAEVEELSAFEPQEFIAEGDKVAVVGFTRGRAKATGREFETDWVHVWTIRGGKVVDYQSHMDTAAAESAFRSN